MIDSKTGDHGPEGLSRRRLLSRGGTVAAGGFAAAGLAGPMGAATASAATSSPDSADFVASAASAAEPQPLMFGASSIRPGDVRYESMRRGENFRFVGAPDEVRMVSSTQDVVRAVRDAVRAGQWIAPRSGGHCFEDFTADPGVKMLLDMTPMNAVGFDPRMRAFVVEPGARLGEVYTALFKGWGVTIPAGGCPDVGAGGHFAGGGYGPLSRRYGSVVDHLYAVEVVVVDADGSVRVVRATREADDPNRELWWAHTGGGGGNFGVVTKYWLRDPGATGHEPPEKMLPPAPGQMYFQLAAWKWGDANMSPAAFITLMRNFGAWHEANSAPGAPGTGLYAVLIAKGPKQGGVLELVIQADGAWPDVENLAQGLVDAVNANTGLTVGTDAGYLPWLHMVTWPGDGEGGDKVTRRQKLKAGYLRKGYTDAQLGAIAAALVEPEATAENGILLIGYGGQVQTVAPDATATAQRDVIMKAVFTTAWIHDSDDEAQISWVRRAYQSVYRTTGGVPAPDEVSNGSYINYPDADLADPQWNTSGLPWSKLYYLDNYPRLQRAKARWDPRNVFHHALSIEPPA